MKGTKEAAKKTPHVFVTAIEAVTDAPQVVSRVKEDMILLRDLRAQKRAQKKQPDTVDAAAEE